jgi:long-chain acyl-CoA synthetase
MLTLGSALARTVRLHGNRIAILDGHDALTWCQFADRVARAAGVLLSMGVERGRRYGLICRNGLQTAELIQAGYWMGAVPVPVNYRLAPPEIAYVLDDAACGLVIVEDVFTDVMGASELQPWADNVLVATAATGESDRALYRRHDRAPQGRPIES